MQPLLKIQTIPIQLKYKVNRASLEISTKPPRADVTRTPGQRQIQTQPARVKLDTFEARASAGRKSTTRSISEFSQEGKRLGHEATRAYAEAGNRIVDSHGKGNPLADMAAEKVGVMRETRLGFIPTQGPEISVDPHAISFHYTMDRLSYDWHVQNRPQLEYIPGNIEFSVAQYNDVIIEYIGSPLYVPPSADPNYEPPTVDITA